MKTIEDIMVKVMNDQRVYQVDVKTPSIWVEVFELANMKSSKNCPNNGVRVMNALEKSKKFTKSYVKYDKDVRMFTLKEEYRVK